MAFRDSLKKYRESQASQPTATPSTVEKTEQTASGSTGSGGSFRDSLQKYRMAQTYTSSLEEWDNEIRGLLTYTQDRTSKWFDKAEYNSLYDRYNKLLAQADGWRKRYAGDEKVTSYIDSVVSSLETARKYTTSFYHKYAPYQNEDEYIFSSPDVSPEERQERYKGQQERIEEIKEKLPWYGNTFLPTGVEKLFLSDEEDALKEEMEYLEAKNRKYERGEGGYVSKTVDDYHNVTQNADFGAASANRNQINPTRENLDLYDSLNDSSTWYYDENDILRDAYGNEIAKDDSGKLFNPNSQQYEVTDRLGIYLSATEKDIEEYMGTIASGTWGNIIGDGIDGSWNQLYQDEIDIYYYLLNTSGQETADKYLSDMKTELNRRETLGEIDKWNTAYDEGNLLEKIAMNAATVPAKFFSNVVGSIEDVGQTIKGNDINPYSFGHSGMHYSQTVRSNTAEDLDKTGIKLPVIDFTLGDIYQTGMSRIDSALATTVFGGGGVVFLGMGAAEEEAYKLYKQGASAEQITLGALSAGAAEAVWEYLSYGKLKEITEVGSPGEWVKSVLVQGFNEMSEEALTEVSNIVSNALIMGSQSDLAELYKQNEEAAFATFVDLLQQTAHAAFGGLIGGFGAGVTQSSKAYAYTTSQYRNAGNTIMSVDGGVDALKAVANEVAGVSSTKMQKNITKQISNVEKNATATKIGRLYNTVQKSNNLANASQNQADIAKSLERKGFSSETANDIAEALVASYNGQELTKAQSKLLKSAMKNSVVQDAISNIIENEQSTMGKRSQNIRNFSNDITLGILAKAAGVSVDTVKEMAEGKVVPNVQKEAQAVHPSTVTAPAAMVSADNKTYQISSGKEVIPQKIVSISSGKAIIQTDNGKIAAEDIAFGNADMDLLWRSAVSFNGINPAGANGVIRAYKNNLPVATYLMGAAQEFKNGYHNFPSGGQYADKLTPFQRTIIYELGQEAAGENTAKAQSNVDTVYAEAKEILESGKKKKGSSHAVLDDNISPMQLNKAQKATYRLADEIAQAVQTNIRVYAGKDQAQGFYNHTTDEIWLNLNAADTGREAIMAFTLAHEIVHRSKKGSPAKYKAFMNFLLKEYGKQGSDVDAMIAEQIDAAEKFNKTVPDSKKVNMTREKALEEVACDACQRMFLDTNAGQKLAAFGAQSKQNKSFLEDLKRWIGELLDKLRRYFKDVEPDSLAAKEFAKFDANMKQILADMYVDMAIESGEKLSTIKAAYGEEFAQKFQGLKDISYNLAATETHKAKLQKEYSEDSIADALADTSDEGIIPQFKAAVKKSQEEKSFSLPKTDSEGNQLSEEQLEYFKDSQVRDKKGKLLVVYHGTTANFNIFKKGDVGFHFGTKGAARGRAGYGKNVNIKSVYLNITNPIVIDEDLGSWDADYRLTKELYNRGILTHDEAMAVLFTDDRKYKRATDVANKKLASVLQAKGYDGIAYQNTFETKKATTSYIAFSSNQAKETTNINPTENPDIRYSLPKADSTAYQESAYNEWDVQTALYDALDHSDTGDDNLIKVGNMPRYITEKFGIEGDFYIYRNHAYENMVSREKAIEEGRPVKRKGETIRFHNLGVDTMTEAVMALENPIMTIATKTKEGNPAVIMILPVKGKNNAPLYSVLSFYSNRNINGDYSRKPHIVLTIAEREFFGSKGRGGYVDIISNAIKDGRVIDFNKEMRDELSVIANPAGVGNITDSSLANNLSHFLKEIKSFRDKNHIDYKLPVGEDTSPRALLANAFEGIITNDIEKRRLEEYKGKVEMLNAEETKLHELRSEIKELSFAKGKRDTKRIKELQFEAMHTANRIATLDKMLLRLEAAAPLQSILKREKEMAYKRAEQKGKEALEAYRKAEKERDEQWRREVKDKYQASKKKAIETRDKREAREKLQRLVLDTVKWITYPSKTDAKCPDILKQPYADFLNSIDLSSQRLANGGDPTKNDLRLASAMSSLATALERVLDSQNPSIDHDNVDPAVLDAGYLDLPVDFVKVLRKMTEDIQKMMGNNEYVVNRMPAEEVRKLTQMIRTLNHAIKEVSTLYANLRFANIEALGNNTMFFVDALGEIEKTGGMKDFVQWDNALPYYAFKRFGEGGESIFEGLMDSQDKLAFLAQKIFDFREKAWTDKEAKTWSEDTHTIDLPNGSTLTLTTADAMSIYCLSRREHALPHLLGGGVRVIGIQKGSQKAKDSYSLLTVKDIDTIISSLTDRQMKVAKAIQEFMSTVCSEWGNEISMKRFLTKEFNEKFYFPIESNDENLPEKDPSAQQSDLYRLLNISATKPLTENANNEVIIRNIFDVFTNHASDMARLNAYGMALLDYMKWLNYREKTINEEGQNKVSGVRKSLKKAFGEAAGSYIRNLIKDVNGRPSDGGLPSFYTRMLRNAKTAMVGSSLRVATLQITSYPRAALVLSPKNLALGLTKMPQIEKAKKYCGIALWKSFGFYDTNIARSIEDQIKGVKNVKQKLIELSLKGAEIGDAITWGALWNACEYEVAATKKHKVGTEEFYQEVGKKLREVVYRTQVVDSTLTRSEMMRSKNAKAQELSAFMSEPTLSANIIMDAGFEFNMEKRRTGSIKAAWHKTGKYVTRAVAVYSVGQLAAALLEGLWDAWRDDDDEEFGEKFLKAFGENLLLDLLPFNKIPIISDLAEAALSLVGLGYFSADSLSSTALSQTVSAVKAWTDVLNSNTSETAYSALYKSMRAVSSWLGVSISGVMREGVALWNNTAGAYDITWKIRTWDLSKSDLASEALEAIIEGNDRQANSIREEFPDEDSYQSAMRTAIKDQYTAGEIDYNTAIRYLIKYGGVEEDDAYWKAEEWKYESETGEDFGKYDEFFTAVETGKNLKAVIKKYTDNGVEMETLSTQITNHYKPLYIEMSTSRKAGIKGYLLNAITLCGYTREEAEERIAKWEFESDHPELVDRITFTQYQRWETDGKPNGVSIELFLDVAEFRDDGTSNSVKSQDEVKQYIMSVASDNRTRRALWCCFYKASTSPW